MGLVWFGVIIFFKYEVSPVYPVKNISESYGFTQSGRIDIGGLLASIAEGEIAFACGATHVVDFDFMKTIGLSYHDGIICEDQIYGVKLFLQSKGVFFLKEKLVCYRIRSSSSSAYDGHKDTYPSYFLKSFQGLEATDPVSMIVTLSSFAIVFLEIYYFLRDYQGAHANLARQVLLPIHAKRAIMARDLPKDPLHLIPKLKLAAPYLENRENFLAEFLKGVYAGLKGIERFLRRAIKSSRD